MDTTNAQPLGPNFFTDTATWLLKRIQEETVKDYRKFWDFAMPFLFEHWLMIMLFLLFIAAVALTKAMMGRWGMLGSVIYNFLYFGVLFLILLIWGTDFFANDLFKPLCTVILYPVCYRITGWILDRSGFKRKYQLR
jgi:hypothetical protein